MNKYIYLIVCLAIASLLTSCEVEPVINPATAYLGNYDCVLVNKTTNLTGANVLTETKTYAGKVIKTAETSLELSLTTPQGNAGLTIPLVLAGEAVVIPTFETTSTYTTAGTTTYLSNYYSGNSRLENKTLSVALNSANYRIIGVTGNQAQISNSDVDCTCVRK